MFCDRRPISAFKLMEWNDTDNVYISADFIIHNRSKYISIVEHSNPAVIKRFVQINVVVEISRLDIYAGKRPWHI